MPLAMPPDCARRSERHAIALLKQCARQCRSRRSDKTLRADRFAAWVALRYLRNAQAYMLISMPTDTSAILGAVQAIVISFLCEAALLLLFICADDASDEHRRRDKDTSLTQDNCPVPLSSFFMVTCLQAASRIQAFGRPVSQTAAAGQQGATFDLCETRRNNCLRRFNALAI